MKRGDNRTGEDYGLRVWLLVGAIVAGATATDVFGIKLNGGVVAELCDERFDAWYMATDTSEDVIEEYVADFEVLEEQLTTMDVVVEQRDTLPIHRWEIAKSEMPKPQRIAEQRLHLDNRESIVPIETFATDTLASFDRFIDKLIWGEEVRIAFLGDSFIEGDILTSDLREKMQATFGGRGVGFVQCEIPFGTARRTVKRTTKGWTAYSVLKPKKNPVDMNEEFFVSGYTARGESGAKVTWQTTTAFERLDSCTRGRILLSTPDSASVRVMLNGDTTLVREFDLVNVLLPYQILIDGSVDKVEMSVTQGTVDCYGASIEGVGGVIVDNLSMRANNGHAIFGTSAIVNRQIDDYVGYDLVVLQYGLNIMEATRTNYKAYRDKVVEMVAYAKSCFPDAAILIVGVSDRWVKNAETEIFEPIGTVADMTSYQRGAAELSGAAFWSAADAMAVYGGMPGFVDNSWAAADHTHINFAGGKRVGEQLYRSIVDYAYTRLTGGHSAEPAKSIEQSQPVNIEIKPIPNDISLKPIVEETAPVTNAETVETEAVESVVDESADMGDAVEEMALESEVVDIVDTTDTADATDTATVAWDNYQMDAEVEESATTSVETITEEATEEAAEETTNTDATLEVDTTDAEEDFFETT
ncbi:MAG: hypothetical protein IKB15_00935 [Alistipes sp.]|nr:hypothetical protein [Alistipes sp.]